MIPDRTAEADLILDFWLDEVGPKGWFTVDPEIDGTIRRRFLAIWEMARHERADAWFQTPRRALANLILLDQFPRNMFRGEAAAFSTDGLARARAKLAIGLGFDRRVPEPERQFCYLPLMHSESPMDQSLCIALIRLRLPKTGADNLDHAIRHRDVIRRFGRFPSRNAALGRADTEPERAYRAGGGYMG